MTEAIRVSNTATFQFVDILTGEEMPGFFTEELAQFCQDYVDNNRKLTDHYYGKDGVTYTIKAVTREQALADDAPEATNTDPDLDLLSDSDDDDQFSFFGAPRPQTQPQVDPDTWLLNLKTKDHSEQWVEVKRLPKAEPKPLTEAQKMIREAGGYLEGVCVQLDDGRFLDMLTVSECECCGAAMTVNGAWISGGITKSPVFRKKARDMALKLDLGTQNECCSEFTDDGEEIPACERCGGHAPD